MRFHVLAIPGQPTTRENSSCAYTQKARKFSRMMTDQGHEVFLYGPKENDVEVAEHVGCYPEPEDPLTFEPTDVGWVRANNETYGELRARIEEGDILCCTVGVCHQPLTKRFGHRTVETGIGYGGVFANYRIFESYAWMHTVYGATQGAHAADGRVHDAVIPNAFDVEDFPFGPAAARGDYLLYVGRLVDRKGVRTAIEVAAATGRELLVAGSGEIQLQAEHVTYLGPVGPEARASLMGEAAAVLVPTVYVEPFGGVAVEAQLCGTPVITTDWGAFTETVEQGVTGFRCHTIDEFAAAVDAVGDLDHEQIRFRAIDRYSLERVASMYQEYWERIEVREGVA